MGVESIKPSSLFHETAGKGIAYIRELKAASELRKLEPGDYFPLPDVPYISQLANADTDKISEFYGQINDAKAMRRFGADNINQFSHWAWRACGIVGVQMIISAVRGRNFRGKTMDLINQGVKIGGYKKENDSGWYHKKLAKIAQMYGIPARTKKFVPASEIALDVYSQNFSLASVKSKRGGHLLLIFGFRLNEQGALDGFWLHDPSDYKRDGEKVFLPKSDFEGISTRRTIVFSPMP